MDPAEQLDILADLASSREADLRDAERHLRETAAIARLKEDEIVRLRAETEQHLTERRRERDEEIKRMMREAEANADTDKAKKETISSRNDLDSLVYQTEKMMKENEAKFSAEDLTEAKDGIEAAKKTLLNQEALASELKENIEKLQTTVQKLSASLYKQDSAQQPGGQTPPEAGEQPSAKKGEDNVIDADFKDVN